MSQPFIDISADQRVLIAIGSKIIDECCNAGQTVKGEHILHEDAIYARITERDKKYEFIRFKHVGPFTGHTPK